MKLDQYRNELFRECEIGKGNQNIACLILVCKRILYLKWTVHHNTIS